MKKLKTCESAATAIEYAIIAAMFSLMVVVAYTAVGNNSASMYDNVAVKVNDAIDGSKKP